MKRFGAFGAFLLEGGVVCLFSVVLTGCYVGLTVLAPFSKWAKARLDNLESSISTNGW